MSVKSDVPKAEALKSELQKRDKQIATLRNEHSGLKATLERQKTASATVANGMAQSIPAVSINLLHILRHYINQEGVIVSTCLS